MISKTNIRLFFFVEDILKDHRAVFHPLFLGDFTRLDSGKLFVVFLTDLIVHDILWLECNVSTDLVGLLLGKDIQLSEGAPNVVGIVGIDQLALLVTDDDGGLLGVAHGEKVSVARDERNIFFAFFAEFFCPLRSMIAKSFKATSGSDQFGDPVGSGVFGGVAHAQRVAWGRGLWQAFFGVFLKKKSFEFATFSLDRFALYGKRVSFVTH